MSDVLPIFSDDSSIGDSILTSDEPEEIADNKPVSIWSIAQKYDLNPVCILNTTMISFVKHYKQAQKLNKQLIFGVKFKIVENSKDKSEGSLKTESNICVWIKNSAGYKDLVKLYSAAHANVDRFYYTGRMDWSLLEEHASDNLLVTLPFYSSFLTKNLMNYNHRAIPQFGKIKPIFHIEEHELPFDDLIKRAVVRYCESNGYEMMQTHSVYYYKKEDTKAYQLFRIIHERTTYEMPELRYFSQPTFSFESWREKTKHG